MRVFKLDKEITVLIQNRTNEEFRPEYRGEAMKPARFSQADKDCLVSLYAPADQLVLVQSGTSKNSLGGSFSTHTWFTTYRRSPSGKWFVAKKGSMSNR